MNLLHNVIQSYAWGSHAAISGLLGQSQPSSKPQAELWMGSHANAPSAIDLHGVRVPLTEHLKPAEQLPFLLKILAAETPLSLQAHPNKEQAREGFALENVAGIPINAPHRNYKDDNHKPELICALTSFDALCGFRNWTETVQLLGTLKISALEPIAEQDLRSTFEFIMSRTGDERQRLFHETRTACEQQDLPSCRWAIKLADLYPNDMGVVASLLLNCVSLKPFDALYLPAGNLHAYLHGVGIEIMANSDNVLRGGCTPKHVDLPELLKVLRFETQEVVIQHPIGSQSGERLFQTPAPEFALSYFEYPKSASIRVQSPEIVLSLYGKTTLRTTSDVLHLKMGESALLETGDGDVTLESSGTVFRARVNRGL